MKIWRWVTLLLVALLSGLAFAHVLERSAKMQYDGALYATLQRTLYVSWGPPHVGGILEPAAILCTLVLAWLVRKRRRAFWLTLAAGIALLAAFPVVFFLLVAPANAAFAAAAPGALPPDWMGMRAQWETGHALRFLLQLLALGLLATSILIETPDA